jgi:Ca-activated chloride channel family protein
MMGGVGRAVVVGLIVTVQGIAAAQQPTYRSETELVNVNVTVTGRDSQPVEGLTEDQFEVFEDGVRQQLKFFAPGDMPLDVAIVLDTSASMAGSLALVQSAAVRLTNALRAQDRASVMIISSGLRVLQPFTTDKKVIAAAIHSTQAAGRTPLYAAIYTTLRELKNERRRFTEPRRQAVVVLSDGQDTASGFGFAELIDTVRRQAVPIYTIAPRPSDTIKAQRESVFGETTHEQDFELRKLASESGARAFFPVALHELAGVYEDIAKELAHQYSLGYHSTNASEGGEFRQIALRVTAPGVRWRARPGYIASSLDSAAVDVER